MLALGLLTDVGNSTTKLTMTAIGAIVLVIGIAAFSPRLVVPLARAIGWPLERFTSVIGRLARGNASRTPGRTAVTAAALMIGLALVLFVTVFANGIRVSTDRIIDRAFAGEFLMQNRDNFSPIPMASVTTARQVPGVKAVSEFKLGQAKFKGSTEFITGFQPKTITSVYNFNWKQGSDSVLNTLGNNSILMNEKQFKDHDLKVGDRITLQSPIAGNQTLTIKGVYDDPAVLGVFAVPMSTYNKMFSSQRVGFALIKGDPGVNQAQLEKRLDSALQQFPEAKIQSQEQAKEDQAQQINQLLAMFYALLFMSIVVALFGIVNTLTLSLYERTRELGMLRAVGMTKRQLKRLVRYESVITAGIGGILGVVLGIFFAWIVTRAVSEEGIVFAIPFGQVVIFFILALIAGVVAAILPARRAAKLDVLEAIAYE
jgi:putative ABC transport system permease protein